MSNASVRVCQFVASALALEAQIIANADGQPQMPGPSGTPVSGLQSVCECLASSSTSAQAMLAPQDPAAAAQVVEWLIWATTELSALMDDKLMKLNAHLQSRTFLVGNALSLADIVVYGMVQPAVASFPAAQILHFCSLVRWADLLQHTVDTTGFFPPYRLDKPKYSFTPPPPPAPKVAAAPASTSAPAAPAKGSAVPAAAPADGKKAGSTKAEAARAIAADAAPAAAAAADKGKGKEAKAEAAAAKPAAGGDKKAASKVEEEATIDMLDIRVGQIVKVDKHPNADALYLEEIDIGEDKPRQVISGLVKFVPKEEMENRRVLVVCNLKPAKMRDVMSYGMVLCASTEEHDKVEPVAPPAGAALGERVTVEGYTGEPLEELNPKKKIIERLFPDMKTNADGVPCYKGVPFQTSRGIITSSLPNAWVK